MFQCWVNVMFFCVFFLRCKSVRNLVRIGYYDYNILEKGNYPGYYNRRNDGLGRGGGKLIIEGTQQEQNG